MLLLLAVFVVLVLGGGIAIIAVVVRGITASRRAVDAIAAEVRSGAIPGLVAWHPSLLPHMSSDWIGSSHYVRGGFGNRDSAAGKVFAPGLGVCALGFVCETQDHGARGRLEITTGADRLFGHIEAGMAWFTSSAGPLGGLVMQSGALIDPSGQAIGQYPRGDPSAYVPVFVRGRNIGGIHGAGTSHERLPAHPRRLLRDVDVRSAEEEAWLVVLVAMELGCFGVLRTHGRMRSGGASLGVP